VAYDFICCNKTNVIKYAKDIMEQIEMYRVGGMKEIRSALKNDYNLIPCSD